MCYWWIFFRQQSVTIWEPHSKQVWLINPELTCIEPALKLDVPQIWRTWEGGHIAHDGFIFSAADGSHWQWDHMEWYLIFISNIHTDEKLRWRGEKGILCCGPADFHLLAACRRTVWAMGNPSFDRKTFLVVPKSSQVREVPHLQATYGCWYPKLLAPNLDFF